MTDSKQPGTGKKRRPTVSIAIAVGGALTLAYPFFVFFGLARLDPRALAAILIAVFTARALLGRFGGEQIRSAAASGTWVGYAAIGLCLLAAVSGNASFFLYYPILVSFSLLLVFALSLRAEKTIIERFARVTEPDLPPEAIVYCRKVTWVWCGFFILNGAIAATTVAIGDRRIWMLYNGLLSYLMIGSLFAVEYLIRLRVRRKHREAMELDGEDPDEASYSMESA